MPTINYHLKELEIAKNPNDPRHSLPTIPSNVNCILDVCCGLGQILLASNIINPKIFQCGVDQDFTAVLHGSRSTDNVHFVCASGDALPFARDSFDMIICRAGLPYMNIPLALKSFFYVLQPGGCLWLTLHNYRSVTRYFVRKFLQGDFRSASYFLYGLFSGVTLRLWGIVPPIPFSRNKYSSFQTTKGITNDLVGIGFEDINHTNEQSNIYTARKPLEI